MFEIEEIDSVMGEVYNDLYDICEGDEEDIQAVINSCRTQEARLLVAKDVFVIVSAETDTFVIWIAHSSGTMGVQYFLPELERLAKSCGYSKIRFSTRRKGFEKLLKDGWKAKIEWEKELVDGT